MLPTHFLKQVNDSHSSCANYLTLLSYKCEASKLAYLTSDESCERTGQRHAAHGLVLAAHFSCETQDSFVRQEALFAAGVRRAKSLLEASGEDRGWSSLPLVELASLAVERGGGRACGGKPAVGILEESPDRLVTQTRQTGPQSLQC